MLCSYEEKTGPLKRSLEVCKKNNTAEIGSSVNCLADSSKQGELVPEHGTEVKETSTMCYSMKR